MLVSEVELYGTVPMRPDSLLLSQSQYLLRRRLEGAAELLRTGDLPVETVARRMGDHAS